MVIGVFTLCYLPGFICILLMINLGSSRVPNALRSFFIVLMAINSALNPIIYMFRFKEFRIAFKRFFRGTWNVRQPIEGITNVRSAQSRMEDSTCHQHGDQPTFLSVPTEELSCRIPTNSKIAVEVIEANLP